MVQHQAVEVAKAVLALKEAGDQLKQSKEGYRKYQKDLKNLKTTLAKLEQEYADKTPGVSYTDVVELRDLVSDVGDDEEWYLAGIAASALNVASKTTALIQQTGAAGASAVTWGFNAGIQLDVDASKTTTENHQTGSLASNLSAANIAIQTGGGAYRDDGSFNTDNNTQTTIQGSHLQAQQGIAINTGDLNVLASKDTSQDQTDYEHGHLTIQQTVWGAVGGPVVSASYDKSQEKNKSSTYNNSTLNAENIDLAANNITINGGNVDANERLRVDVGEKLHVESVQNRSSGSNKGFGISGGFGFAGDPEVNKHTTASNSFNKLGDTSKGVNSANGGINASSGRYTNRETVLSTLTSGNEADINVGGETRIVGALVATLDEQGNDRGKLNLKTNTLSYEDLSNTRYSQNRSAGISTSVGLNQANKQANTADPAQQKAGKDEDTRLNTSKLQYSNESGYSKTKILATLGEGNISVADEVNSDDLARLNRDVTATEKELFSVDRQQGNIDVTLDHRLLSKKGQEEIKEELKELPENIGKVAGATVDLIKSTAELIGEIFPGGLSPEAKQAIYEAALVADQQTLQALFDNLRKQPLTEEGQKMLDAYFEQVIDQKELYAGLTKEDATLLYQSLGAGLDGTQNNGLVDKADGSDTNIYKWVKLYNEGTKYNDAYKAEYIQGVATQIDYGFFDRFFCGFTGCGSDRQINDALKALGKNWDKKSILAIDLTGFSRGAGNARTLANKILIEGIPGVPPEMIYIRSLMLYDTVGSNGIPGNGIDIGHDFSTSEQIGNVYHATAEHEYRNLFDLQSVKYADGTLPDNAEETSYPGVHSGIAGGYRPGEQGKSNELALIVLEEMNEKARANGIPLAKIPKEKQASPEVRALYNDYRAAQNQYRQNDSEANRANYKKAYENLAEDYIHDSRPWWKQAGLFKDVERDIYYPNQKNQPGEE